ncbi:MAG: hypothetical protein EPO22_12250 [Dehalococcoidia bacterium]|nr:MAG: hypothetical protein EPO22_12250 [Dehalococcoidia bacterium]
MTDAHGRPRLLAAYVIATAIVGLALTAWGISDASSHQALMLAALVVAACGAELFAVELFVDSHVSVSGAVLMAAGAIFGMWGVAATALPIIVAGHVRCRTLPYKDVFNFGALTIAGAAYVAVFRGLDGDVNATSLSDVAAPAVVAGLANMAANSVFVAGAISLDQHQPLPGVWRGNYLWLVPQYAALGAVAIGVALLLTHVGTWSLVLFALPLVSLSEALHTRAEAMKMRSRALEAIGSVHDHRRAA